MTLTEFLPARIAEDEETVGPPETWVRYDRGGIEWSEVGAISEVLTIGTDRVWAECKAKRRRLAIADDLEAEADDDTYGWAHSVAEQIRKVEALPYANHPDYREEWKP